MNKSTPLSDLPHMKKQDTPAYEEKENQIVSEILSEIDNSNQERAHQEIQQMSEQNINMEISKQEEINREKMLLQQQFELEKENLKLNLQNEKMEKEKQQQEDLQRQHDLMKQELSNKKMEESLENTLNEDNFVTNIINMVKQPSVVALIVFVLSIPQLSNVLTSLISKKEQLVKYTTVIVLFLKAIMGGSLFFGINNYVL
tara:strand:- start:436 stop:1038 length:603 start_codon:yes stop_codon:yes gene_type:complete